MVRPRLIGSTGPEEAGLVEGTGQELQPDG
jgi:hypothetical protein